MTCAKAIFSVRTNVTNYGKTVDEAVVDITLLDQDGKQVAFISDVVKDIRKGQETVNTASVEVKNPRLWSAETPYLYTAILELKDKDWQNTRSDVFTIRFPQNRGQEQAGIYQ